MLIWKRPQKVNSLLSGHDLGKAFKSVAAFAEARATRPSCSRFCSGIAGWRLKEDLRLIFKLPVEEVARRLRSGVGGRGLAGYSSL